eukprot:m.181280 g.181280  ORF g.181280 m.181280 type:complete len:269 (+) comp15215_c0_seq1:134-940(+)
MAAQTTMVMHGKLRMRRGVLGFYILGETWPFMECALIQNHHNPRMSMFQAPLGSWSVFAGDIVSASPLRDGKFMDDMGTMLTCRHRHAFQIAFSHGSRIYRKVLAAASADELQRWMDAFGKVLAERDRVMRPPHAGAYGGGAPAAGMPWVPSPVSQYPAYTAAYPTHPQPQAAPPGGYAPASGYNAQQPFPPSSQPWQQQQQQPYSQQPQQHGYGVAGPPSAPPPMYAPPYAGQGPAPGVPPAGQSAGWTQPTRAPSGGPPPYTDPAK